MAVNVQDRHPAIAVKEACLARSGVYEYTLDEMRKRGYEPSVKKPIYREYRPADVLRRCKDKFGLTAVTVEHTLEETNPENFSLQVCGIVGDNLSIKPMGDGEVGVFGNMAFYTQDGFDYYQSGNRETSADYRSVCVPDKTGRYDFILDDILSVNGVVLTARGRGGPNVRVMDTANKMFGGNSMNGQKGVLSFLGIGRAKDAQFKLSKEVLDGAKTLHTLDAAGREKLAGSILDHVVGLTDGKTKDLLVGAIKDSLSNPTEAVKQEEKVARVIDGLYDACLAAQDEETVNLLKGLADGKTLDAKKEEKTDDKEEKTDGKEEKKDNGAKTEDSSLDMAAIVDKVAEAMLSKVTDSIGGIIDKKISEALGIKGAPDKTQDAQTQDSLLDGLTKEDGAFLLGSAFNQ